MRKLVLSLAALLVLACGEKKSKTTKTHAENTAANYTAAAREAEFQNDTIAEIYDGYNRVKVALVKTDATAASKAAKALLEDIKATASYAAVKNSAEKIGASTNINEQREAFEKLTAAVKQEVEHSITSGTLYYQYCPMAFDGKGAYWISNEEQVYNPYYGDVMLNCGTVDSKLN